MPNYIFCILNLFSGIDNLYCAKIILQNIKSIFIYKCKGKSLKIINQGGKSVLKMLTYS